MIYALGQKGPLKVDGYHDPDNIRPITLRLKPEVWEPNTVYMRGASSNYSVVVPSVFKGLVYRVLNPGISHATTEPDWQLTLGDVTEDFEAGETDGLTWENVPYNMLPLEEDISAVTFTPSNGVTLASSSNTTHTAAMVIDAIAADADARTIGTFQIRVRVTTTTGRRVDITLEFKLADQ